MRIVHIGIPVTGVGVYLKELASHINDKRFDLILICDKKNQDFEILNKSKIPIKKIYVDLVREINVFKDLKCLVEIIIKVRKLNPNLIHCHSAKAGILGRISGLILKIPTYYTPHAYSYLSADNKVKKLIFKKIEKFFRFFPTYTLACSISEFDRTLTELHFNKSQIFLWNNSIENPTKKRIGLHKISLPSIYLCSVGRPSYQKNIKMQIEAVAHVKKSINNIHLVLIGSGLDSKYLIKIKKIINERNLEKNITLIPQIKREEVLGIINNCKLYLSSSRYEGLPYSVIEALSCSKPCIVTNVDGNKDLVKDNYNGFLIELGDSKDMSDKIISLLENKAKYDEMCDNSRKSFNDNYDILKNINKLEEIYLSKIT